MRTALNLMAAVAALGLAALRCDAIKCKTVVTDLTSSCLPDTIAVDREVQIEFREACGRACARQPNCTATLVAGVVVLDVQEDQCNDAVPPCPTCLQRAVPCHLPPLPQGDYALRGPGLPDEIIRVRPGGATACTLPDAGM